MIWILAILIKCSEMILMTKEKDVWMDISRFSRDGILIPLTKNAINRHTLMRSHPKPILKESEGANSLPFKSIDTCLYHGYYIKTITITDNVNLNLKKGVMCEVKI